MNLTKWLFRYTSNYFDHKIVYTQPIKQYNFDKNIYIQCLMPHGIIPFNMFCLLNDKNFDKNIPVVSDILYDIPLLSHLVKTKNAIPARYNKMDDVLSKNKSIIVYAGGVQEVFETNDKKEIIVIKKRKGIFHLALKNGISLLPMYTFGITQLHEKSEMSLSLPILFKNKSISWYSGLFNTPFPMRKNLLTVVGNPIRVSQRNKITDKDISLLRDKYIAVVISLFNKWKTVYNPDWKDKELHIK